MSSSPQKLMFRKKQNYLGSGGNVVNQEKFLCWRFSAQGLLLALYWELTPVGALGGKSVQGIKPKLATGKARTLPIALPLWPPTFNLSNNPVVFHSGCSIFTSLPVTWGGFRVSPSSPGHSMVNSFDFSVLLPTSWGTVPLIGHTLGFHCGFHNFWRRGYHQEYC